jgi:hypothetical protein
MADCEAARPYHLGFAHIQIGNLLQMRNQLLYEIRIRCPYYHERVQTCHMVQTSNPNLLVARFGGFRSLV